MIELKQCCKVPFPEKLFEEYKASENAIHANVGASKVVKMMKRFVEMHDEPMFFILELPSKDDTGIPGEKTLSNTDEKTDVYFIDGLDAKQATMFIDSLGNFLIKDGMNTFGIGGHESHEEILFGKYNVMTIYTRDPAAYHDLLDGFGIRKTENLVTAWDTFTSEHPGECERYVSEETGKTI